MSRVKTRSWAEVSTFYHRLVYENGWRLEPLLKLVLFIAASPYADGLYPATSVAMLRIGRYPDFAIRDAELLIEYESQRRQFHFRYFAHPSQNEPEWEKYCDATEGATTLERFLLKQARWFKKDAA